MAISLWVNHSAMPVQAMFSPRIFLSTISAVDESVKLNKNGANEPVKPKKITSTDPVKTDKTGTNDPVKPKKITSIEPLKTDKTGTIDPVKPKKITADTGNSPKKSVKSVKESTIDDFDELEKGSSGFGYQFIFSGFIEMENIISTYTKQDPGDINKKNEIRTRLSMQAGNENYYFKCVPNFYILPLYFKDDFYSDYRYSDDNFKISRNGRISGKYYEASFNECYLNLSFNHMRLRAGNQIYGWGTSDVFNPTSFINPSDSRELFYKDSDETTIGVPSLSSMIFASDFTLELVYVPVHIGAISPAAKNFWAYQYELGFLTLIEKEYKELPLSAENSGYGARLAGCISGVDLSLSAYRGPDASPLLRPMAYIEKTSDILVQQEYHTSTNFGTDCSFKLWKFELHGEFAYSPDKYGVVDETPDGYVIKDKSNFLLNPFSVRTSRMYSYSAGMNFIQDKLTITSEWIQSGFADKSLMLPFNTDLIASSISYSFFDNKLRMSMGGLYDVKHLGYVLMPSIYINIDDVSVKIAYSHMSDSPSDEITMFSVFKKHDILILALRYEF